MTRRTFSTARILPLVLVASLAAQSSSPEASTAPPRIPGEYTLQYGVEWRLIRAGMAKMNWRPNADGWQADLQLDSAGIVSKLYRVQDVYRVLTNAQFCPSYVALHAEEGKRRRETKITFDPAGKVSYVERDLIKNNLVLSKELQTVPCVLEYLGALNRLRGMRFEPGQFVTIPLTDGKKFAQVKVEAQEREQIRTPVGTFNTMRYEVHMFNNVLMARKARMHIWLSEDARRLPVKLSVRMQFLIGTITLHLEKEEHS